MKGKTSALNSAYIIDGITMKLTPKEILDGCLHEPTAREKASEEKAEPVVDESTDPAPTLEPADDMDIQTCLSKVSSAMQENVRECPMSYAGPYTKGMIAKALLDSLWMRGHFKLGDLSLNARWRWNAKPLGNMAGFYSSVVAASEYMEGLGIDLIEYSFNETEKPSRVEFKVEATRKDDEYEDDDLMDLPGDAPFGSDHPTIGRSRSIPNKLAPDPASWIIFIPFDSCDFRLGCSLLSKALGQNFDTFPEIGDADYFIDCFEVVREFVEDKIVVSAITVAEGGILTALKLMCHPGVGAAIDVGGIMNAYGEKNEIRVLFSEVPGILIQIKDADYDYADAEFLLQDIAYYPIGHPAVGNERIEVKAGKNPMISDILQSLLNSQTSEGED